MSHGPCNSSWMQQPVLRYHLIPVVLKLVQQSCLGLHRAMIETVPGFIKQAWVCFKQFGRQQARAYVMACKVSLHAGCKNQLHSERACRVASHVWCMGVDPTLFIAVYIICRYPSHEWARINLGWGWVQQSMSNPTRLLQGMVKRERELGFFQNEWNPIRTR